MLINISKIMQRNIGDSQVMMAVMSVKSLHIQQYAMSKAQMLRMKVSLK